MMHKLKTFGSRRGRVPRIHALIAGILILSVSCGTSGGSGQGDSGKNRDESASAGYESVTVENCGIERTFENPPERVVTMNQHTTETMLALGLEDSMVGTAYLDLAILPEFREEYESIPVLAEQYPSREVVLEAEPDFVFGGYASAFEPEAAGGREGLHELGIDTYLMTEYCPGADESPNMEQVYTDIRNIGRIFGVEERADRLVEEMRTTIEETQEAVEGVREPRSVAYVDNTGESAPVVAGGSGMVDEIIGLAGGENVYPDLDDQFTQSSYEEFVSRDPQVILIGLLAGDTGQEVREGVLAHPALSDMEAVTEERFVEMDLSNLVAGVRNAQTVRYLAERLYPERFEGEEYEPRYPGQFEDGGLA